MSFTIEQFKKYKVFLNSGRGNMLASVHIPLGSGKAILNFVKGRKAKNKSKTTNKQTLYTVNIDAELYPNYIDLLRNEKPLFFFFDDTSRVSYITTSDEPVGEGE